MHACVFSNNTQGYTQNRRENTKLLTHLHATVVVMTKEAQARIDALNEEKAQAKAKVEEIKYSGTGSLGSRRCVCVMAHAYV